MEALFETLSAVMGNEYLTTVQETLDTDSQVTSEAITQAAMQSTLIGTLLPEDSKPELKKLTDLVLKSLKPESSDEGEDKEPASFDNDLDPKIELGMEEELHETLIDEEDDLEGYIMACSLL